MLEICLKTINSFQTDEDVFINVPRFVHMLDSLSTKETLARSGIFGRVASERRPFRVVPAFSWYSKYYCTRTLCPENVFPDYVEGLGYLFHASHAGCFFKNALESNFMPLEDVFLTGILGDMCSLKRIDIPYYA